MSTNEAAERLRDVMYVIRQGHQPMYNGRPSCALCGRFVDSEETHTSNCPSTQNLVDDALAAAKAEGAREKADQVWDRLALWEIPGQPIPGWAREILEEEVDR